jgi:hypothetical protein
VFFECVDVGVLGEGAGGTDDAGMISKDLRDNEWFMDCIYKELLRNVSCLRTEITGLILNVYYSRLVSSLWYAQNVNKLM